MVESGHLRETFNQQRRIPDYSRHLNVTRKVTAWGTSRSCAVAELNSDTRLVRNDLISSLRTARRLDGGRDASIHQRRETPKTFQTGETVFMPCVTWKVFSVSIAQHPGTEIYVRASSLSVLMVKRDRSRSSATDSVFQARDQSTLQSSEKSKGHGWFTSHAWLMVPERCSCFIFGHLLGGDAGKARESPACIPHIETRAKRKDVDVEGVAIEDDIVEKMALSRGGQGGAKENAGLEIRAGFIQVTRDSVTKLLNLENIAGGCHGSDQKVSQFPRDSNAQDLAPQQPSTTRP
ncbi:hypothetical protein C8R44DRAFT_742494 [Mycena epipterygia]|nr:hypothetical protein C8R44DRAFT_742494 [Mycena epipterygia]